MSKSGKIPVCLITGFLGTGKTTTLKNIVERYRSRRIIYLVNEFCATDIDGALVKEENVDVVMIPGGSIFCKCLVTQFIGNMKDLPLRYPNIEGLVIEASGMANPSVIEQMLLETGLDELYEITNILTIVDPGSYLKLQHTLPNVVAQVKSADRILLNKVDLYDNNVIKEAETALLNANSNADITRTTNGIFSGELFESHGGKRGLTGDYALCRDPNYSSETVTFDGDIERLKKSIIEHSENLYRVKGYASSGEKNYYVDYSSAGLRVTETFSAHEKPALAIIYRGQRPRLQYL